MSEKPASAIPISTISRADFDLLRKLVGRAGPINLPNERIEYDTGSVIIVLPEKFSGVCTHNGNVRRAEFHTPPAVKYSILSQKLSQDLKAISISGDSVTLELPWMPDVKLTVER